MFFNLLFLLFFSKYPTSWNCQISLFFNFNPTSGCLKWAQEILNKPEVNLTAWAYNMSLESVLWVHNNIFGMPPILKLTNSMIQCIVGRNPPITASWHHHGCIYRELCYHILYINLGTVQKTLLGVEAFEGVPRFCHSLEGSGQSSEGVTKF